jgi:hypothetical protein
MAVEEMEESGEELFRKFLRVFPGAFLEDYFKNGKWDIETLLIDTELIDSHRKEAGAPEPPPLEEVQLPVIPKARVLPGNGVRPPVVYGGPIKPVTPSAGMPSSKPGVPVVRATMGVGRQPIMPAARQPLAQAPKKPSLAGPYAPKASPTTATSEGVMQILNFIKTWQLEPSSTRMQLAKLNLSQRAYVIKHYQAIQSLDEYIQTCRSSNVWASAATSTTTRAPARTVVGASVGGSGVNGNGSAFSAYSRTTVKRPLAAATPNASSLPSYGGDAKRLRTFGPGGGAAVAAPVPSSQGPKPPAGRPPSSLLARGVQTARPTTQNPKHGGAVPKPSDMAKRLVVAAAPSTTAARLGVRPPSSAGTHPSYYSRPSGLPPSEPQKPSYTRALTGGGKVAPAMAGTGKWGAKASGPKARAPIPAAKAAAGGGAAASQKPGSLIKSLLQQV